MRFDVFFSICQMPVNGALPSEAAMFKSFFDQVALADELGYGTAWVAETHLSCQVQKRNPGAVIPHFQGEIGLNTDILQLAHLIFGRTRRIGVGSAIRNILCNGGPLAHAEAVKTFLTLAAATGTADRRLELGFAAGRFPFSNTPYGIVARTATERAAWPVVKTKIFQEATEIFLRVLRGDVLGSADVTPKTLTRGDFRTDDEWTRVAAVHADEAGLRHAPAAIPLAPTWVFDPVGVIPFEAPLGSLALTIGTHDAATQALANRILPCGVFNLSITPPAEIEATHARMTTQFHPDGGPWRRERMPRTALVFLNDDRRLTREGRLGAARAAAVAANEAYWRAMEGTLDPRKVEAAVDNALVGDAEAVVAQIRAKYHPDDRLMLWFDFNTHDNEAVKTAMRTFMTEVAPRLA